MVDFDLLLIPFAGVFFAGAVVGIAVREVWTISVAHAAEKQAQKLRQAERQEEYMMERLHS